MQKRLVAVHQFDGNVRLLKMDLASGEREIVPRGEVDETQLTFGMFEAEKYEAERMSVALLATPEGPLLILNKLQFRPDVRNTRIEVNDGGQFPHFLVFDEGEPVFDLFYEHKFGIGLHPYLHERADVDFYYWLSKNINNPELYQAYTKEIAYMTFTTNPKLAPIYGFFEKYGTERLHGLDPSYFLALDEREKEEAWIFLSAGFALSAERISALYNLDENRAVVAFKKAIDAPTATSPYPAEKKSMEECRLLMLECINRVAPDERHVAAINEFAGSEFEDVRAQFARSVPIHRVTRSAVDALKRMIFTETETIALTMATTKFMVIHGMDFSARDPLYKSIYRSLCSDDPKEKLSGMKQLEEAHRPDYA
jgi:hypothetical protein